MAVSMMGVVSTAFTTGSGETLLGIMLLIGLVPLFRLWRRQKRATGFLYAYLFLFIGTLASILESMWLPTVLNYVEHVGTLLAAGSLLYYMRHTKEAVETYG